MLKYFHIVHQCTILSIYFCYFGFATICCYSGYCIFVLGLSDDDVGKNAAKDLLRNLSHAACVDEYIQDQVQVF